ncbi:hypothetical protein EAH_00052600 [Eimeria acervulina]|uniref:Uncharacterized protein n=1 Tax=Eimeria acervulina TaxID=5801 RepID=U6H119_EIMAC|nr:hypothetical protein EAH_00052600 [Eimeria acervulina]CDI84454.1 hypothetical protein EAH_00052600 [Eimeria acervulina]
MDLSSDRPAGEGGASSPAGWGGLSSNSSNSSSSNSSSSSSSNSPLAAAGLAYSAGSPESNPLRLPTVASSVGFSPLQQQQQQQQPQQPQLPLQQQYPLQQPLQQQQQLPYSGWQGGPPCPSSMWGELQQLLSPEDRQALQQIAARARAAAAATTLGLGIAAFNAGGIRY